MQLNIPDEIAAEIEREAGIRRQTPEEVAIAVLRSRFAANGHTRPRADHARSPDHAEPKNLLEFLGDFVGCVDSSKKFPEGSTLGRDASKVFAEMLAEERRNKQ